MRQDSLKNNHVIIIDAPVAKLVEHSLCSGENFPIRKSVGSGDQHTPGALNDPVA